jgi:23S rRNA (pseudouridine1915-N3)-methyltransferase
VKIRVLWPGKTKKPYCKAAIEDYAERIGRLVPFEIVETQEEATTDRNRGRRVRRESEALIAKQKGSRVVYLSADGRMLTSEEFAKWLEQSGCDAEFVLGGPHGCEAPEGALRISFGKLTLPHELARVVLLEQIYRALTIIKRIPYHK